MKLYVVAVSLDTWEEDPDPQAFYYFTTEHKAMTFQKWLNQRPGVRWAQWWPVETMTLTKAQADFSDYA